MSIFNCTSVFEGKYEFVLDEVVNELRDARTQWRTSQGRLDEQGGRHLPSREIIREAVDMIRGVLFPMRLGPDDLTHNHEDFYVGYTIGKAMNMLLTQIRLELEYQSKGKKIDEKELQSHAFEIVRQFSKRLPAIRLLLDKDVIAAFNGDPAASSVDEVLLCYPGIQAMIHHRIAHELYKLKVPLSARIIAEMSKTQTGIDIHPGAQIGSGCFIDHGTGVVIGETAIIGENVRIYQAVSLGAKSFPSDENGNLHKGLPRHPIVEDDVIIYANATVLGRVTIGKGTVIGANVWVMKDIAAGSFVSQTEIKPNSSL